MNTCSAVNTSTSGSVIAVQQQRQARSFHCIQCAGSSAPEASHLNRSGGGSGRVILHRITDR